MKLADQIEALRAAQGDVLRMATVDVDLAFGDAPETLRAALRELLVAAAVPHWFDAAALQALAGPDGSDVAGLLPELARLRCIESFAGRGSDARNVHQATRRRLREALAAAQPQRLAALSARAAAHFAGDTSRMGLIEHLYHLLVSDPDRGADLAGRLADRWSLETPQQYERALALALEELLGAGLLQGRARGAAQLLVLNDRLARGDAVQLRELAADTRLLMEPSPEPLDLVRAIDLQGQVAYALGETSTAAGFFGESLQRLLALTAADVPDADAALRRRHLLAVAHTRLGDVEQWTDPDSALQHFERAVEALEAVHRGDPQSLALARELAVARARQADVLAERPDRLGDAVRLQRLSFENLQALAARDPDNTSLQRDLSTQHDRSADIAAREGRLDDAVAERERAIEIARRLVASDASNLLWQADLAQFHASLGENLRQLDRLDAAELALQQALAMYQHLIALQPGNSPWTASVRNVRFALADLAGQRGRHEVANDHLRAVVALIEHHLRQHPGDGVWMRELAIACNRQGQVLRTQGNPDAAQRAFALAVQHMEAAKAHLPPRASWDQDLANLRGWLSA